jgi:hypothetical protein
MHRFKEKALLTIKASAAPGKSLVLLLVCLLACGKPVLAQTDSLGGITRKLRQHQQQGPHEKLFLHLDRPVYLSGETMWFKLYAVEGTYSRPLALSSVVYVEVLNAAHQPVLQSKVALKNATGQGSFVLPTALTAGSYTVRAYTSWMKNFSPDSYFHRTVTVINTAAASGAGSQDSAAYEVQLFPEGGNLVRGLRSRVAFKVTDKTGRGVAATGKILNQQGAVVTTFKTLRLGMGSFTFTPAAGSDTYTAVVTLGKNRVVTRPLPKAYEQGYVLHLEDSSPTQLLLLVNSTNTQPETMYLLGHSRQKIALTAHLNLIDGKAAYIINKLQLLEGVSHLTLFNASQKPVCERLYFQAPKRQLGISAGADKAQYTPRDKVSVQLSTTDQQAPVAANLSMAVYRLDSLTTAQATTIDRYLWLTSDLRGTVENPDYYFTATGPEAAEATDNLMLTQGWSRFRWEDVLSAAPKLPEFPAEPSGPLVRAQLTHSVTHQPRMGITTYLSSPSRVIRLTNALSNAQGLVQFEMPHQNGSQEIILQTDPLQDSTCQITVLDPFSTRYASTSPTAFGLSARFQRDYAKRHFQAQVQQAFADKRRSYAPSAPVDSLAFFGKPTETYFLDKYTRFKVLEEVLREYVPGVMVRIRKDGFHLYVVDKLIRTVMQADAMVLLDGVPVFNTNKIMAMNPLKIQKLEVIDARYLHGPAIYNGLVSFTTYKGDLEGFPLDAHALVQQYESVQRQREFYAPRYDTPQEKQSRVPDLRNLLYWNPQITSSGAAASGLSFYTGDQAGRFLVVVQGLAANGLAGSTSFTFEVKQAL